jgi:hypothetical protein
MYTAAKGAIYIVKSDSGLTKIGISNLIQDRINSLKAQNSDQLSLVCYFETPQSSSLESKIHKKYADARQHGEWFDLTQSEVREIVAILCEKSRPKTLDKPLNKNQ